MSKLENLLNSIKKHKAIDNPFYEKWTLRKLPLDKIAIFARNYWEVTYRFPEALTTLILNIDNLVARAEYTKTLYSEMGNGVADRVHSVLFEKFCLELSEKFGKKDFLKMDNLKDDFILLPETIELIKGQKELYSSSYSISVGAQLALEWQAYTMIRQLYEGARNYMNLWEDQDEFHEACEFFYAHIGVTEKDHKLESMKAAQKIMNDGVRFEEIEYGFHAHLNLIANFWDAVARDMKE